MPLDNLIRIFLKLLFKIQNINPVEINEKIIKETKERVFRIEFEILDLIGFDLNIDMPYVYLHKMSNYFKECIKAEKLIFCTTSFLNDSFKLPLCLFYDPLLILLACIYLCEFYFNVKLLDYQGLKWYQIIDKNVDFYLIKEIFIMLKFNYDNSSVNKHVKDFEFYSKEFLNKSILDFDKNKFYNKENETKSNLQKIKDTNKSSQNKDSVNFKEKDEIKEYIPFSNNSIDKGESNISHDLPMIKVYGNKGDSIENIGNRFTLELNEVVIEKNIINNKNTDNRYKKLKITDENMSNSDEKDIKHNKNIDKIEINSSFFDKTTVLQVSNFINDIKNKVVPECP